MVKQDGELLYTFTYTMKTGVSTFEWTEKVKHISPNFKT